MLSVFFIRSIFLFFFCSVHAVNHASPPPGALVVAKSGAKYSTLQSAINALSKTNTSAATVFIYPGVYSEQVYISPLPFPLTIYGFTNNTLNYISNTVTITSSLSQANTAGGNDKTATLRAWTSNLKIYNLNIVNAYGKGSQAVALSSQRDGQGYYGCQFRGYQDTVLANEGRSLFVGGLLTGVTDFIFGQRGRAWFEGTDIRVLSANLGYVTANGRDAMTNPSYYVFHNCTVAALPTATVPAGSFYLGRPWRDYARVVFQSCQLSSVISPAGWHIWNTGDENTEHVTFGEWGNEGPGSAGNGTWLARAKFSTLLKGPVGREEVLGPGWGKERWVDKAYVS